MPFAKSSFAASETEVCRMRVIGYSTGSSSVITLMPSELMWLRIEYSVVVLPLPVGPVTRMMPSGRAIMRLSSSSCVSSRPSLSSGTMPFCRSRIRSTRFSPWLVGRLATRKSTTRPDMVAEMRPSCGARVSAIFIFAITLMRTAIDDGGVVDLAGLDLFQDAVDRELVPVVMLDGALDLGVAGEAQLDLELALQVRAQLVDRDDVVGVGERDDELFLLAVERDGKDAVAPRQVTRQRLERRRVDDDASQVYRLQPELFRQRIAQCRLGHEAELHQQAPHRHVLLGLLEQRDAQLVLGQDSLVDQDLADVPLCLRIGG